MNTTAFPDEIRAACRKIGENLRSVRLNEFNETQQTMAERIGISRKTYIRMEQGDPAVKIGYWLEAARILRTLDQWNPLFAVEKSLFDRFDATASARPGRKRATS